MATKEEILAFTESYIDFARLLGFEGWRAEITGRWMFRFEGRDVVHYISMFAAAVEWARLSKNSDVLYEAMRARGHEELTAQLEAILHVERYAETTWANPRLRTQLLNELSSECSIASARGPTLPLTVK